MTRGYFGIGIENGKTAANLGTLWRSAYLFGAAFIFTIGRRYDRQASDTMKSYRHIPLVNYRDIDTFNESRPFDCPLVGVELSEDARPIANFVHPQRAIYLLGAEDNGLSKRAASLCQHLVTIPTPRSLNVAVAGSIVLFDRVNKRGERAAVSA